MTKFWTEVDVPFVLEKHVLPQGPWARCCLIKDKSKGGGEMVCICLSILSHLSIWRLCSCACEARVWNNCSIIWDSSCGSVPPLLPGLPVTTDVYFMKVMDGFWGCNFFLNVYSSTIIKRYNVSLHPTPTPSMTFKLSLILSRCRETVCLIIFKLLGTAKGSSLAWGCCPNVRCSRLTRDPRFCLRAKGAAVLSPTIEMAWPRKPFKST